jgi:hypothetical protein
VTVAIFESGCIIIRNIGPEDAEVVRSYIKLQAEGVAAYIIKEDPKIIMADTQRYRSSLA